MLLLVDHLAGCVLDLPILWIEFHLLLILGKGKSSKKFTPPSPSSQPRNSAASAVSTCLLDCCKL